MPSLKDWFRTAAQATHPDHGGDTEAFKAVTSTQDRSGGAIYHSELRVDRYSTRFASKLDIAASLNAVYSMTADWSALDRKLAEMVLDAVAKCNNVYIDSRYDLHPYQIIENDHATDCH